MIATVEKQNKLNQPAGIVVNSNATMMYHHNAHKANKHARYIRPASTKRHIAASSTGHRPS
uniref:Uncharacterized protein n=1 Tax=Romanomermis culicivorax TaxID=13658 RepID=A0A915JKL6_ROMCU